MSNVCSSSSNSDVGRDDAFTALNILSAQVGKVQHEHAFDTGFDKASQLTGGPLYKAFYTHIYSKTYHAA